MVKIKKIDGFEGYYITDTGKVMSTKPWRGESLRFKKNKYNSSNSTFYIHLYLGKKQFNKAIHRLLAQAFIPIPDNYKDIPMEELDVHHKDFNHENNRLENLMWITKEGHLRLHSENEVTKERKKVSHIGVNVGDKHPNYDKHLSEETKRKIADTKPKKSVIQYTKDGEFVAEYESAHEAARQTGVAQGSISKCCLDKRKSAGGFIWRLKVC